MGESHKTHRPHIKVGKDEEKKKCVCVRDCACMSVRERARVRACVRILVGFELAGFFLVQDFFSLMLFCV